MTVPRAPAGLGRAGRSLWRGVTRVYELSPAELVSLQRACRTVDLLARLDAELAADVTAEGSMGQVRAHPLLRSLVELEGVLDAQLRSLALPMPGELEGHRRSPAVAAQARWKGRRGSVA